MIQAAPAPAHDLFGMGQDLCRRLAPSPAPCRPQGKRASLRRRRSVGSAPANGIDAVKRTASIAFGSCTRPETDFCDREGRIPLARLAASHAEGLLWTAADSANRPVGVLAATIADDALHVVMLAVARAHQRRGV